jgi:hypothetical protein
MNYTDQHRFCEICDNRVMKKFDLICGKTGEKPSFQDNCPDFSLDEGKIHERLDPLMKEVQNYIDKVTEAPYKEAFISGRPDFLNNYYDPNIKLTSMSKLLFVESRKKKVYFLILANIVSVFFTYQLLYGNVVENIVQYILMIFFIAFGPLSIFLFFDNRIVFSLTEKGIKHGKKFYEWNDILFINFKHSGGSGSPSDLMEISFYKRNKEAIIIDYIKYDRKVVATAVIRFLEKYKANKVPGLYSSSVGNSKPKSSG